MEAQKYIASLHKKIGLAESRLKEVKEREYQLQAVKEALLRKKKELSGGIQERRTRIEAAKQALPDGAPRKLFDDVFPVVDSCYHKELLLRELQEQLTLAKALREERDYTQLIQGLSEINDFAEDVDKTSVLRDWFGQMKKHVQNSIIKHCGDDDSFYNVKASSCRKDSPTANSSAILSFSTRHKGYCLHLTLEEERIAASASEHPSAQRYTLTSDIHLSGLQEKGEEYLQSRKSALDFITDAVWPLMEQEMCA